METIDEYLLRIKDVLDRATFTDEGGYLDLASADNFPRITPDAPPPDSLVSFQEIVLEEIAKCSSDKIKVAVNELLKHLLVSIDKEREHFLAERYLYRVRMIFKRCLMPDFPYAEEVWNYVCDCLRSVGTFMVEQEYYTAAREVINSLAGMGRIAALKGLPTANTQSSLRIMENLALRKKEKQLASTAKNARFNLEI